MGNAYGILSVENTFRMRIRYCRLIHSHEIEHVVASDHWL